MPSINVGARFRFPRDLVIPMPPCSVRHECDEPATFHIEVDVLGAWQTPRQWGRYKTLTAEPGETIEHNFPRGFQAQWACLVPERATAAPATFIYE